MKNKVILILQDIFNRYHSSGIDAIYLWGSITTKDFNSLTSDVDSVAIVKDSTNINLENEIKKLIAESYPEINKLGIRFLYKGELNGGKVKSFVASVINPQTLLLDLPNWELVAGKSFKPSDFSLAQPSYKEAINLALDKFIGFKWLKVSEIPEGQHLQLLKTLARIIDYQQKDRGNPPGVFSYSTILARASSKEKEIAEAIFENKKNNWDYLVFAKYTLLFQEYVDQLLQKRNPK